MAKRSDKKYLDKWAMFRENMSRSTPIDLKETEAAKRKRIQALEADCEKWFAYYFPIYYKNKPAPFHIKASKRVTENSEWLEVRSWARSLAKSTRTMMEVLYLSLTGKKKNWLMIADTEANAIRLLSPYKNILGERTVEALNHYEIDPEWVKDKFGIAITGKKEQNLLTPNLNIAESFFV